MPVAADVRDPITALDVMGPGHCREALRDWLEAGSDDDKSHDDHNRHENVDSADNEDSAYERREPQLSPLSRLSPGAREEAAHQVAAALDAELGGINIGELLVEGWASYDEVMTAGRETAAAPDTRQVLDMASHSMDWTGRFSLRVSVDGVQVESAEAVVQLHLVVQALVATVAAGRLMAIGAGTAITTATVAVGPFHVTSDPVTFKLERLTTVSLGPKGMALVPAESVRSKSERKVIDVPEKGTDIVVP